MGQDNMIEHIPNTSEYVTTTPMITSMFQANSRHSIVSYLAATGTQFVCRVFGCPFPSFSLRCDVVIKHEPVLDNYSCNLTKRRRLADTVQDPPTKPKATMKPQSSSVGRPKEQGNTETVLYINEVLNEEVKPTCSKSPRAMLDRDRGCPMTNAFQTDRSPHGSTTLTAEQAESVIQNAET